MFLMFHQTYLSYTQHLYVHPLFSKPLGFAKEDEDKEPDVSATDIPFQKVNLTFKHMHYTVTASTSNEKLELLKGIDGFVEAGKMTALMGSSGTTTFSESF